MFQWFLEHGVFRNSLHIEMNSCDTLSNIRNSLKIVSNLGYSCVLLVSSPLHLYRISFLHPQKITPEPIMLRFPPYSYEGISPQLELLSLFKQTHHEWISLGLYLFLPEVLYKKTVYYVRGCKPGSEGPK